MTVALDRKLQEEVQEYLDSNSVEEMVDILDILEVLHGMLAAAKRVSWERNERMETDHGSRLESLCADD